MLNLQNVYGFKIHTVNEYCIYINREECIEINREKHPRTRNALKSADLGQPMLLLYATPQLSINQTLPQFFHVIFPDIV